MTTDKRSQLLELTRHLGRSEMNYVIIGEGNTSCRIDGDSFWIKASGYQMNNITEAGFVAVRFEPLLALLDQPPRTRTEQDAIIQAAKVDQTLSVRPSIEVSFHAMLLHECQAGFVGHTHPVEVNKVMCSSRAEQFAKNRIFPDEVVVCGPESVFVPYADPGLPLAIIMRERVRDYIARNQEAPKVILLANHGLIVLGDTPTEILNRTAMAVKAATIFAGACAVSEPVFMSQEDIWHIYKRPDEIYRSNLFK